MNNWSVYLLVVLALLFAPESSADDYDEDDDYDDEDHVLIEDIDQDQIVFKISKTLHGTTITWRKPNNKTDSNCYKTEVQYKSQCVKDWKRADIKQGEYNLDLPHLNLKMNYDFRIRMKLECLNKNWSNWTKVQSWGNNTGACTVKSSADIWVYILKIVLPLTSFLLVCLLAQHGLERIRRLILPKVPDPKHFKNITDIDQSQWWGTLTQLNEECTTTDIEIIDKSEREEQHQTLQPIDTNSKQHDNMYCIYSSEASGEKTEPQYSQMVLGYVTL